MARSTGGARTVYDAVDKARAEAHEAMGQGLEAEPRTDVPDPAASDEVRGRLYGMATPGEIRTGRRFPLPTKHADPKGLARVAARDYEEQDRQRGAALTDSNARP